MAVKTKIEISRQALKDLKRAPDYIQAGLTETRKRSGWHDEPLQGKRKGQRTPMNIKQNKSVDALEATKDIWAKMTFGGLIRSLRMSDELLQVELAKKLSISKQFLSDVENNRKDVGISFAKKVADVLGYSVEPLIELLIRDQLKKQNLNYIVELKKAS